MQRVMQNMNAYIQKSLKYLIILGLMYMPIFGHLDTLPIRIWDESRLAINSYEMLQNRDYIVTHYDGKPDMWNTKPPLLIWIQVLFMKMFGVNEFSVRLPSAIAAFLTCITILFFSVRYLTNFWFGFIAVFVLMTSHGYINIHATRTGDYDALLTLFTTLSGLLFFVYCEKQNYKYLYLFFLFTALAVLTKSITGLLFLPAIFLYSIIQKQLIPLLKNKHFYIGLFSFLLVVVSYYLIRELYNPGYLKAVQQNELGGRYLEALENNKKSFWYYYTNFIDFQLTAWYILIPCGLATGFFIKNQKINRLTLFSFLMIITFFIVISFAQTKLEWYDVPLYPFIAIVIGIFIFYVFDLLQKNIIINQTLTVNVIPYVFLFILGITPYQKIIAKTYKPKEYSWHKNFYEISYYLQDAVKNKHDINNQFIVYNGYNAHILFYVKKLNDKGISISFKDWKFLEPKDIVIVSQNKIKQYIEEHYINEIIQKNGNILTYKIYERKNAN
mgnify:CR=1 FL=1